MRRGVDRLALAVGGDELALRYVLAFAKAGVARDDVGRKPRALPRTIAPAGALIRSLLQQVGIEILHDRRRLVDRSLIHGDLLA